MDTSCDLSVLSWNVLAEQFVLHGRHDYSHVSADEMRWEHRSARIIVEALRHNCDILCLQEVDPDAFDNDFEPAFEDRGYTGLMNSVKRKACHPGTCVFWRHDKLEVVWSKSVDRTMTFIFQQIVPSRSSTATVPIGFSRRLALVNAHLPADPKDTVRRLRHLTRALTPLVDEAHHALVLVGDFNCELGASACTSWLEEGKVDAEATDWGAQVPPEATHTLSHKYALESAYEAEDEFFFSHTVKGKRDYFGMVDHVWYTSNALELNGIAQLFDEDLRATILREGLPSSTIPSDHLPLSADFRWIHDEELVDISTCAPGAGSDGDDGDDFKDCDDAESDT